MVKIHTQQLAFNILSLKQIYFHFADIIFNFIFLKENVWILLKISLEFVPKIRIYKYSSTGLDNGSVPTKQKAIIWTNDGWFSGIYIL